MFTKTFESTSWGGVVEWNRGIFESTFVLAANILWEDLPLQTQEQVTSRVQKQVDQYLNAKSLQLSVTNNNGNVIATKSLTTPTAGVIDIKFYDDLKPMGTFAGVYNQAETDAVLIGLNTNKYANTYLYRPGLSATTEVDSGIARTKGWHNLRFIIDAAGTNVELDGVTLPKNSTLTKISTIKLANTWNITTTSHYDNLVFHNQFTENFDAPIAATGWTITQAGTGTSSLTHDLNFLSKPRTSFIGDTAAEENAWNATFLAQAYNYFPTLTGRSEINSHAKCLAFHAITRSTDNTACGFTTQTVHDDWSIDNHGRANPGYAAAVLNILTLGAQSYIIENQPVPSEFNHNLNALFSSSLGRADPYTYNFPPLIDEPDWGYTSDSFYQAIGTTYYLNNSNNPAAITTQQLAEAWSLNYPNQVSQWIRYRPTTMTAINSEDNRKWHLNANPAGYIIAPLINFDKPTTPEPTIAPPPPMPPDLNSDGSIDIFDVSILFQYIEDLSYVAYGQIIASFQ